MFLKFKRHPTAINITPPHAIIGTGHQSCPVWGSFSPVPEQVDDDDAVETASVDEVTELVEDTGSVEVDEDSVGGVGGSVVVISPP